jgi:UDPglucose 6-dehydrogenase
MMAAIDGSNDGQTTWVIDRATGSIGRDWNAARVAVLGMTFKAGTDDLRDSPALRLAVELVERGATVTVHDPVATERASRWLAEDGSAVLAAGSAVEACRDADAVFVATEWEAFGRLDWQELSAVMRGRVVVDARSVVDVAQARMAGFEVLGLPSAETSRTATSDLAALTALAQQNGHADDGIGEGIGARDRTYDAAFTAG